MMGESVEVCREREEIKKNEVLVFGGKKCGCKQMRCVCREGGRERERGKVTVESVGLKEGV